MPNFLIIGSVGACLRVCCLYASLGCSKEDMASREQRASVAQMTNIKMIELLVFCGCSVSPFDLAFHEIIVTSMNRCLIRIWAGSATGITASS